jgi:hypothetical protein
MDHKKLLALAQCGLRIYLWRRYAGPKLNRFRNGRGGIAGLKGNRHDLPSCRFDFLPTRNEVVPIGAFDKDIRQNSSDQFTWRFFVEEYNRIHGLKTPGKSCSFPLIEEGPRRTLQPLYASVRVQSQDQSVSQ